MNRKSEEKKYKKNRLIFIIILLSGIFLLVSPIAIGLYFKAVQNIEVEKFNKTSDTISPKEKDDFLKISTEYNKVLADKKIEEKFSDKKLSELNNEQKKGFIMYNYMFKIGKQLGYVEISKIHTRLPIYAGTGDRILNKGAGLLEDSSIPVGGKNTNPVITAHRGVGNNKLFKDVDKLQNGDVFFIVNNRDRMKYIVRDIYVVEPGDFSKVQVVKDKDYCSLLTCTPYLTNEKRLIIRGERIGKESRKEYENKKNQRNKKIVAGIISAAVIIIAAVKILKKNNIKKKRQI